MSLLPVWNFLEAEDRRKCREQIIAEEPYIVIGSPPCIDFCIMNQNLNCPKVSPSEVRRRQTEASILLNFAVEIYKLQLDAGRHVLHEHPLSARSWQQPCMVNFLAKHNKK